MPSASRHARSAVRLRSPIPPQKEKPFQAKVVAFARFCRWRVWTHWLSIHSPGGWPDLFMVRDGVALAVELKVDGEEPRDDQLDCLIELDRVPGILAVCWHPSDWDQIVRTLS